MITIGIDPHKASHTAVALDDEGRRLGELRVVAAKAMLERLLRWAERWPERIWAVEGASGLGHLLAQQLVAHPEMVLDVPATLAARARLLARGHGRKTDAIDAASVARVAQSQPGLRRVGAEDHSAVLRLLSDRRDELTQARRTVVNRLHRLLPDLHPGGAPTELSAEAAARLLGVDPTSDCRRPRAQGMAQALLADLRRLDRALVQNRTRCAAAVLASGSTLTGVFGISDVLAAKIQRPCRRHQPVRVLGSVRELHRHSPNRGLQRRGTRHRLSRSGNRSLNNALHLAARVQTMHPGAGRDHYERKLAEHKSSREALRSLKRQLAKVVYRQLVADREHDLALAV